MAIFYIQKNSFDIIIYNYFNVNNLTNCSVIESIYNRNLDE